MLASVEFCWITDCNLVNTNMQKPQVFWSITSRVAALFWFPSIGLTTYLAFDLAQLAKQVFNALQRLAVSRFVHQWRGCKPHSNRASFWDSRFNRSLGSALSDWSLSVFGSAGLDESHCSIRLQIVSLGLKWLSRKIVSSFYIFNIILTSLWVKSSVISSW